MALKNIGIQYKLQLLKKNEKEDNMVKWLLTTPYARTPLRTTLYLSNLSDSVWNREREIDDLLIER